MATTNATTERPYTYEIWQQRGEHASDGYDTLPGDNMHTIREARQALRYWETVDRDADIADHADCADDECDGLDSHRLALIILRVRRGTTYIAAHGADGCEIVW